MASRGLFSSKLCVIIRQPFMRTIVPLLLYKGHHPITNFLKLTLNPIIYYSYPEVFEMLAAKLLHLLLMVIFCSFSCSNPSLRAIEQGMNNTFHHAAHSMHSHVLRHRNPSMPTTMAHAQLAVNCPALIAPIKAKRDACHKNATDEVDLCVYFASDYRFVVPFLIHHLSLGVTNIFIYNNDEKVPWYNHPAVLCLVAEEWVHIQPWFGEKQLMRGLDHCYKSSAVDIRAFPNDKVKRENLHRIWGANFDIDEMLVLHGGRQCFTDILQKQNAPSVALNWAFFVPEVPIDNFDRTGNVHHLPEGHRLRNETNGVVLPHDMLTRRMYENMHIKTVTRLTCVDHFVNEHCPTFRPESDCPYGSRPIDPQGHYINCGPWTPWVDNYYPVAQLNHYWTLSLQDFMRKIHRGKGGSYAKGDGNEFRGSREFFTHARQKLPFVDDESFLKYYGGFFEQLKVVCPACFDVSFYHLTE